MRIHGRITHQVLLGHAGMTEHVPARRLLVAGWVDRPDLQRVLDERGAGVLPALRGRFCLAYVSPRLGTAYLYHSVSAVRPFYYRQQRDGLAFATDPEDLCDPDRTLASQVDAGTVAALALEAAIPDDASWYREIRRLPAGYLLTFSSNGIRVEQYDDVRVGEPARISFRQAAGVFRELCEASVSHAVAGRPRVAVQLSGGLDSAVVAYEASRTTEVDAFHFHYDLPALHDERAMATLVSDHCGLSLDVLDGTRSLAAGGDYLSAVLPTRGPLTHGFFAQHLVSCGAGPQVLLSGVGGDELHQPDIATPLRDFGWRAVNPLASGSAIWQLLDNDLVRQLLGKSMRDLVYGTSGRLARFALMAKVIRGTAPLAAGTLEPILADGASWLDPGIFDEVNRLAGRAWQQYHAGFERARQGVRRTWLEMYLTYTAFHRDSNDYHAAAWHHSAYDAHSVEYVTPLLDPRLVEFCLTLDTRYRRTIHRGHTVDKALMRAAYAGRLPRRVLGRLDKVDYGPVHETFLLNNKDLIMGLLGPDSCLARLGIVRPDQVHAELNGPTWRLRRKANELLHTASLELWLRGCQRRPHEAVSAVDITPEPRRQPRPNGQRESPVRDPISAWRLEPHVVVRFLPDEAVLLDQRDFRLYRINATSAKLLSLALRCDNWRDLEIALRSEQGPQPAQAHGFIVSLVQKGLMRVP